MNVNVNISVMEGDTWTLAPKDAAQAILDALGGDETKDIVTVSVGGSGQAGNIPQVTPPPMMMTGGGPNPVPPSA